MPQRRGEVAIMKEGYPLDSEPAQQEAAVVMPSYDDMAQRLRGLELQRGCPMLDDFYNHFTSQLDQLTVSAADIVATWYMTHHATWSRPDYVPLFDDGLFNVAEKDFDHVIDALCPSTAVAEQAKAYRTQMVDKVERRAETCSDYDTNGWLDPVKYSAGVIRFMLATGQQA